MRLQMHGGTILERDAATATGGERADEGEIARRKKEDRVSPWCCDLWQSAGPS